MAPACPGSDAWAVYTDPICSRLRLVQLITTTVPLVSAPAARTICVGLLVRTAVPPVLPLPLAMAGPRIPPPELPEAQAHPTCALGPGDGGSRPRVHVEVLEKEVDKGPSSPGREVGARLRHNDREDADEAADKRSWRAAMRPCRHSREGSGRGAVVPGPRWGRAPGLLERRGPMPGICSRSRLVQLITTTVPLVRVPLRTLCLGLLVRPAVPPLLPLPLAVAASQIPYRPLSTPTA